MPSLRVLAGLLAGALLPVLVLAALPSPSASPVRGAERKPANPRAIPFPGGILAPTGRIAYLSSATGGIDAVDLVTGDVVWRTIEAQVPILAFGDRLYAQAGVKRNRLRLLVFDTTREGECVLESDPVVLPAWVITAQAHGRAWKAAWRLENGTMVLAWQARAFPTARRPTPSEEVRQRRQAAGTARIDLFSGQVKLGPAEKATTPPPAGLPRPLERLTVRWHGFRGRNFQALILEDVEPPKSKTPILPAARQQKLVMRSWDWRTGKPGPSRELLRGHRPRVQLTLDERYLCLRDGAPSPDELVKESARRRLDWAIYSLDKGKIVGRLPYEPGTQRIQILGKRAFIEVSAALQGRLDRPTHLPSKLLAIDLHTARTLWQHPLAGKHLSPPAK